MDKRDNPGKNGMVGRSAERDSASFLNVVTLCNCSILNLIFTCGLYNFLSDFTFMFRSYLWFLL